MTKQPSLLSEVDVSIGRNLSSVKRTCLNQSEEFTAISEENKSDKAEDTRFSVRKGCRTSLASLKPSSELDKVWESINDLSSSEEEHGADYPGWSKKKDHLNQIGMEIVAAHHGSDEQSRSSSVSDFGLGEDLVQGCEGGDSKSSKEDSASLSLDNPKVGPPVPKDLGWMQPSEQIMVEHGNKCLLFPATILSWPKLQRDNWVVLIQWNTRGTRSNVRCSACRQHSEFGRAKRDRTKTVRFTPNAAVASVEALNSSQKKKKCEGSAAKTKSPSNLRGHNVVKIRKCVNDLFSSHRNHKLSATKNSESAIQWHHAQVALECKCDIPCVGECRDLPKNTKRQGKKPERLTDITGKPPNQLIKTRGDDNKGSFPLTGKKSAGKDHTNCSKYQLTKGKKPKTPQKCKRNETIGPNEGIDVSTNLHPSLTFQNNGKHNKCLQHRGCLIEDPVERNRSTFPPRVDKGIDNDCTSAHNASESDSESLQSNLKISQKVGVRRKERKAKKDKNKLINAKVYSGEDNVLLSVLNNITKKRMSKKKPDEDVADNLRHAESRDKDLDEACSPTSKQGGRDKKCSITEVDLKKKRPQRQKKSEIVSMQWKNLNSAFQITYDATKQSDVKGAGVIARRDIKAGEMFCERNANYHPGKPPEEWDADRGEYIKTKEGYIDLRTTMTIYINGAIGEQTPNVGWRTTYEESDGKHTSETKCILSWKVLRNIKKEEEILGNYDPHHPILSA